MPTFARSEASDKTRVLENMRAGQNVSVLDFANFLCGSLNYVADWLCEKIVEADGVAHILPEDAIVTVNLVTPILRLQQGGGDR